MSHVERSSTQPLPKTNAVALYATKLGVLRVRRHKDQGARFTVLFFPLVAERGIERIECWPTRARLAHATLQAYER